MAQHDYVIANQSGSSFRSDLNNALSAIVSQNSGASEPTTTYAYQTWADTTNGVLKIRNAANSAWIQLYELDGTFSLEAGSASSPALYFTGDTNTGIYSPGADQFAISTGGTARVYVGSTGSVGLGTSSPSAVGRTINIYGGAGEGSSIALEANNGAEFCTIFSGATAADPTSIFSKSGFKFATATAKDASGFSEKMRLDSSGRLGIGTASPTATLQVSPSSGSANFQVSRGSKGLQINQDSDSADPNINAIGATALKFLADGGEIARFTSNGKLLVGTPTARTLFTGFTPTVQVETATSATANISIVSTQNIVGGANFWLGHARGANGVLNSGDELGALLFNGGDGTDIQSIGAKIAVEVDGTPGNNDMPGRLVFSTTADGASSPTERMRIGQDGRTNIFAASGSVLEVANSNGAGTTNYIMIGRHSSVSINGGTSSYVVYTNGNVQNTNNSYGSLSDAKLKENIVDATSQWSDIKALQIRKYNFKEETGQETHTQIGLIAQEVELVSPGLVSESPDLDDEGNDLGTVTKSVNYSVLYMKAVKALQEAMERIETLEAKVAALEGA